MVQRNRLYFYFYFLRCFSIFCFSSFSHLYRGVSWCFFSLFSTPIDNNTWYARVGIFKCLIRYVFLSVRHCHDINFFINLLNKTKSYLALLLSFLIFCLGVTVLFLFIYFSLALFLYQNRFSSYTSNETPFLVSLHCLPGKSSLNYSVSRRFTLLTYIQSFICTSCIWNKILLIQSGDVELNRRPKKLSSLSFFYWNLNGIAAHDFEKISLIQSHALFCNIDIIFLSKTFLDSFIEIYFVGV